MPAQESLRKIKWRDVFFSALSVIMISVFPAVFMYAQNAAEASFSDVVSPLLYFMGAGVALWLVLWLVTRRVQHAAVATGVSMLVLTNYSPLESLIMSIAPELRYWHCLMVVVFILVHVVAIIACKLDNEWAGYGVRIILAIFGMLVVTNVVTALPSILNKMEEDRMLVASQAELQAQQDAAEDSGRPNIYYLILDEYSGFNTVKKCLGYDNEAFAQHLESLGFTVSRDSYNETMYTIYVTANLIDLSYNAVYPTTSAGDLNAMRYNGRLFQIVKEHGYKVQGIGSDAHLYGLARKDSSSATEALTLTGKNLSQILIEKTPAYPLMSSMVDDGKRENILRSVEYIKDGSHFPASGMFTIMHVVFPHEPFLFDENGDPVPSSNQLDWTTPEHYIGQYKYATTCAQEMVEAIIARDPEAIIILQSDHSARAVSNVDQFMKLIPYEDTKNILNAVYIGGEPFEEMQGQSGVNTLRLLLNKLFDCEFEILEVPHGSAEVFELVEE